MLQLKYSTLPDGLLWFTSVKTPHLAKPCKTLTHAWGCLQKITKIHSWSWFPHNISPMNMAILIVPGVPSSIILWPSGGRRRQSDCWLPIHTTSAKSMFLQSFWVECSLHMVCCSKKNSMKGAFKLSNRVSKNKKKHPKTCAESWEMRLMEGLGVSSSQIGAFPSLAFLFPRTEFRVLDGFLAYGKRKSRPLDSPQCMSYANPSWNS